jgi:hypothetical protein
LAYDLSLPFCLSFLQSGPENTAAPAGQRNRGLADKKFSLLLEERFITLDLVDCETPKIGSGLECAKPLNNPLERRIQGEHSMPIQANSCF